MTTARVGPQPELVRQAAELVPTLRKNAAWAAQNGRLHEETIGALAAAGVFRMRVPARHGGYGSAAQTLVEVAAELGRGDGSAAWAASAWWMAGWTVGLFPEPVQAEVFASPDTRVCGTLSPDGTAVRRADGLVVSGRWRAVTGAWQSQWQQLVAIAADPDGAPEPVLALVPVTELEVVADPQDALPGAGTASTVAAEVFVPAERVVRLGSVLRQRRRPARGAAPGYRTPLLAVAATSAVGTMIGLAKAAQDDAFERLLAGRAGFLGRGQFTAAGRAATPGQATAPPARPRLAGAATMTDQAETRAHRIASVVDAKEVSRTPWTVQERDRARADFASACRLAIQAADLAGSAVPVPAGHDPAAARQLARDVRAVHQQALVGPCASLDLIGRLLSNQEPGTFTP